MKLAILLFTICFSLVSSSVCASVCDDEKVFVVIETQDGKVAWSKIVEAVVKEVGAEVPSLGQVPAGDFDINASSTRLVMYGLNKMLLPAFRISVNRKNDTVVVRVNKTELEAARKQLEEQLRGGSDEAAVFGLKPFREDAELEKADHVVVLVHGFNSSTSLMGSLAKRIEKDLRKKDLRKGGSSVEVACFDYASQHGILAAASSLEESLQTLIDKNPDCSISLVTHSMGGVVARTVIEKEDFAMPQVQRLIMVGPPNHGTQLAALPSGNAAFDSLLEKIDGVGARQAIQALASTANIAIEDLKPDSECLTKLNAGDRNASVAYSIILGDLGVLSASDTKMLSQFVKRLSDAEMNSGGKELTSLLETLPPELVTGQGDGVVSVEGGKLSGVEDTIVMSFRHRELLQDNAKSQGKIIRQIVRRLKREKKISSPN